MTVVVVKENLDLRKNPRKEENHPRPRKEENHPRPRKVRNLAREDRIKKMQGGKKLVLKKKIKIIILIKK